MNAWRAVGLATQFGLTVVVCMASSLAGGTWLDRRLGTAPAFLLSGIVMGLACGAYLVYAIYRLQAAPPRER